MLIKMIKRFRSSSLLKSFSVYVFSSFFNQGVNILLLPLFTYYLTPFDYGILSLVNTTISVVSIFVMVGADGAIRRQFYKLKGNEFAQFFISSLFTCLISFIVISILIVATAWWLGSLTHVPIKWILLSPVISFTSVLPTILLGLYRVEQKATSYAVVSNLMTLANLGLAIWLIVGAGMNYEGRLYSILVVNLVFSAISVFVIKKNDY